MEPNNIENQFREKLNSREIQPSASSWDRLDVMLSTAEVKKPKRTFYWLAIAASFVVFVSVGTIFFNTNSEKANTIQSLAIENKTQKNDLKETNEIIQKNRFNIEKLSVQTAKTLVQYKKNSNSNNVKNEINTNEETVAVVIQSKEITEQITNQEILKYNTVEDLLASVQKPSKTSKMDIKINSASLLNEVDSELTLSFREKALNTINKKYQEAKVALANRNNE